MTSIWLRFSDILSSLVAITLHLRAFSFYDEVDLVHIGGKRCSSLWIFFCSFLHIGAYLVVGIDGRSVAKAPEPPSVLFNDIPISLPGDIDCAKIQYYSDVLHSLHT